MKTFAFLLATLFSLQAFMPALCMTNCAMEPVETSDCCLLEETSACCAEQTESCSVSEEKMTTQQHQSSVPCSDCCIPCCSAPLCCFFFQEITDIDLSSAPVVNAGPLPSNNGVPHSGYLTECFQPPELIN